MENQIEIYQSSDGQTQIDVSLAHSQQLAYLLVWDVKAIDKYVNNVFSEGEIGKSVVVANIATTTADGKVY